MQSLQGRLLIVLHDRFSRTDNNNSLLKSIQGMTDLIRLPSTQNRPKGILPNFIIIGAMKCGTTSLHYYLNCHPQISMAREKELNFFVEELNWQKGIAWYRSQFTGNAKIYGEASPAYTSYPRWQGVAQRMYETIPQVKLIYMVRDPIERIISHYVHKYADGGESRIIAEALANYEDNLYIFRSQYFQQLKQYLSYFSESNILILTAEDLYNFPQKILRKIFNFIGVTDNFDMIKYHKKLHASVFKRMKTELGNSISMIPINKRINYLPPALRYHLNNIIFLPFSQPVEKPTPDQELHNRLVNYLKDDINRLREYTGSDFDEWSV